MTTAGNNADAWGLPGVLGFFDTARASTAQVYPSEWFFLREKLKPGMSVLDVGCAQGGFAGILAEHLDDFNYTGIDINPQMIARAAARHPRHSFHTIAEDAPWTALAQKRFDLVLVLGILHLHEGWRDTIRRAWDHCADTLILDLREHHGPTLEDKAQSYMRMDFGGGDDLHDQTRLPYIIVNSGDALATIRQTCAQSRRTSHFGYLHPVSDSASTPADQVMANVWCLER